MRKRWIVMMALAMSGSLGGCRELGPEHPLERKLTRNGADDVFLQDARGCSLAACSMALLARAASEDSAVKRLAASMYTSSRACNEKLQLLTQGALQLPTDLSAADKNRLDALERLTGRDFEAAWLQYQQDWIANCLEVYKNEVKNGQLKFITDYAADQLPGLLSEQKTGDSILHHL